MRKKQLVNKKQLYKYVNKKLDERLEDKRFNKSFANYNVQNDGNLIIELFTPAQGAATNQRVGDTVRIKSIKINMHFEPGDPSNEVRLVVFQWGIYQTPLPTNIWHTLNSDISPISMIAYDDATAPKRILKVLRDRTVVLDTYNPNKVMHLKITKGFTRLISFSPGTNTPLQNQLYLAVISDSGAAFHPTFSYTSEIIYEDA